MTSLFYEAVLTRFCQRARHDTEKLEHQRSAGECGGAILITNDPGEAAKGADALYTDVWASMGQEEEAMERRLMFQAYRIDQALLDLAAEDAIVLHCLPAHRGEEITDEVIDGPHSVVWDQAENRLHTQKALLLWLLGVD